MSSFTKALITKKLTGDLWEVNLTFQYHVGKEGSLDVIVIPQGFVTDLASVPWPATMFIPKDGTYDQAAVVHDYLYHTLGLGGKYNRKQCDRIFLEAMGVLGVPLWKRRIMYRAVRIGGGRPWRNHQKAAFSKTSA